VDESRTGRLTPPDPDATRRPTAAPTIEATPELVELPEPTVDSYVASVCTAIVEFRGGFLAEFAVALQASFSAGEGASSEAAAREALAPLVLRSEEFVFALAAARPPDDLRSYHEVLMFAVVDGLSDLRSGTPSALDAGPRALTSVASPASEGSEQLTLAAGRVPACVEVGFASAG
jgi:hypothetical protein